MWLWRNRAPSRQSFSSISLPLCWNQLSKLDFFTEMNLDLVYVCGLLASISSSRLRTRHLLNLKT
jgi:hypothetical protein